MGKLRKNIISAGLVVIALLSLTQLLFRFDSSYLSTSIINNNGKAVYSHELTIILDDAHGFDVAGKSSPDALHKEWIWSKFWINELGRHLTDIGFKVVYTSPEDNEPGLWTRVSRMNQISGPALVISLHNNAAGSGEWKNAHGFSIWTTKGLTRSDSCATILFNNLRLFIPDLAFRQDLTDGDPDYECNFIVLLSKHPSFLIEYMFQDNLFDIQLISNAQLSRTLLLIIDVSILQIEQYLIKQQKKS